MKKILLSFFVLFVLQNQANAQKIELSGYGGYMISGSADFYNGSVNVGDAAVYGATLGVDMGPMVVQFLYNRNVTTARVLDYRIPQIDQTIDFVVENYHLGVEKLLGGDEMIKPYGAFSLGVAAYTPKQSIKEINTSAYTKFSIGLGLGVKIFPKEKFGIKLQAKMFMPMNFGGIGISCGGGGCGSAAYMNVPIVHGEFTGGVVLRIGE